MILGIESIADFFFVYCVIFDIKIVQIGELLLIVDGKGRNILYHQLKLLISIFWIVLNEIIDHLYM